MLESLKITVKMAGEMFCGKECFSASTRTQVQVLSTHIKSWDGCVPATPTLVLVYVWCVVCVWWLRWG